jgi:OmpA-OmpF porin, OOP family
LAVCISPLLQAAGANQRQQNGGKFHNLWTGKIMTTSFTKKQIGLAISCALALGFVSVTAGAETISPTEVGYVVTKPDAAVRNSSGGCWRTGTGPAETARTDCGGMAIPEPISRIEKPAPQPVAMAEPVMAPPPQPVAAVAVVAPRATERLVLNADTLFDFDKSTLRPAGKAALDEFIEKTRYIDPEMITAVGHTDRIGSESYNQSLSEQRAEAVKAYLVSKGIDANRIKAEGKGESEPVTLAGECQGANVIACLQPDRNVEIEVTGNRIANR